MGEGQDADQEMEQGNAHDLPPKKCCKYLSLISAALIFVLDESAIPIIALRAPTIGSRHRITREKGCAEGKWLEVSKLTLQQQTTKSHALRGRVAGGTHQR